jgi:hypothetical protein
MEALTKAVDALAEAVKKVSDTAKKTVPDPKEIARISGGWWLTILMLIIVANTLITIYLYPTQRPDYWWLPGAWIWFSLRDWVWIPIKEYIWPETIKDPNKRKRFSPPRIA